MSRLPTPGGDSDNWGDILNDFLSQVHTSNGALKQDSVTADAIAPNAVTSAAIAPAAITTAAIAPAAITADVLAPNTVDATVIADGSITNALIADGTIEEGKLSSNIQLKLNAASGTQNWDDIINKPTYIAAGSDQAAARTAIGAGTANTKVDIGLGDVDNTSDASKPISIATQNALDAKASVSITVTGDASLTGGGDLSTNHSLTLVNDAVTPGSSKYYGTDTLGAKGYFNLPTYPTTFTDDTFTLQDNGDNSKQLQFQLSGITTSTTRTLTVPDANTTLVGTDTAQALTNKTISGVGNTFSNIPTSALPYSGSAMAYVSTGESTSSKSYTDLTTTTDSVTVTIGASGMALALVTCTVYKSSAGAGNTGMVSYAMSGANSASAADSPRMSSVSFTGPGYNYPLTISHLEAGLNPGSTTFKMKYQVDGGTAVFLFRKIVVIPL